MTTTRSGQAGPSALTPRPAGGVELGAPAVHSLTTAIDESAPCDYHSDRPAAYRLRWTVYGGAFKYRRVCEECREKVRGQRGVDVFPVGAQ